MVMAGALQESSVTTETSRGLTGAAQNAQLKWAMLAREEVQ